MTDEGKVVCGYTIMVNPDIYRYPELWAATKEGCRRGALSYAEAEGLIPIEGPEAWTTFFGKYEETTDDDGEPTFVLVQTTQEEATVVKLLYEMTCLRPTGR